MALTPAKLSPAMWRLLGELAEPNSNHDGAWYFPMKNERTLKKLAELGFARHIESDMRRCGYAITGAGRARWADRGGPSGV